MGRGGDGGRRGENACDVLRVVYCTDVTGQRLSALPVAPPAPPAHFSCRASGPTAWVHSKKGAKKEKMTACGRPRDPTALAAL